MPAPTSWFSITSAPNGENTSPAGTESFPITGSKYIKLSTIRDYIWNYLTSLTAKTTLADADQVSIADSAASNVAKKITWANVMVAILAYTGTLTNKRITRRESTETSSATPTINTDNTDCHIISALAAAITSFTTNLSGTPTSGQSLDIEILDNGTARAITWGASFASGPATLPTTTILSKWLYIRLRWSASRSKWICMSTGSEQ